MLLGASLIKILRGIVTGAVATLVIGFYWGSWFTNG
jgi:hypothetical protein